VKKWLTEVEAGIPEGDRRSHYEGRESRTTFLAKRSLALARGLRKTVDRGTFPSCRKEKSGGSSRRTRHALSPESRVSVMSCELGGP